VQRARAPRLAGARAPARRDRCGRPWCSSHASCGPRRSISPSA
jgi:hypothetical protein